jgi:hypothetical protein
MKFPEKYRIAGDEGQDGAFVIPYEGRGLRIIASTGMEWDHVSVSLLTRCPNWKEMSFIKDIFWNDSQTVMQLHVPKKDHINYHPFCLHLWRPQLIDIILPPSILV